MGGHIKVACSICGRDRYVERLDVDKPCYHCKHLIAMWLEMEPVGPWVEDALCSQTDPEVFFPSHRGGTVKTAEAAKRICAQCPVQAQCFDYSLRAKEPWGVWGGVSEVERRRITKEDDAA